MRDTILLDCPKCGRKIGIPGAPETIHVTCPTCGEQWDWPLRGASARRVKRERAGRLAAQFSRRISDWYGATVSRVRFSGAQLAIALIAGIGIGVLLGFRAALHSASVSGPQPEPLALPGAPDAGMPGTNLHDTNMTNFQDLKPESAEDLRELK
jgi:hypothetical protein